MANMTITTPDIDQIRALINPDFSADDLETPVITGEAFSEANDHVFTQVFACIEPTALNTQQKALYDNINTGAEVDIDGFMDTILFIRQREQFKRAIIHQTAGNLRMSLSTSERIQAYEYERSGKTLTPMEQAQHLYDIANDNISRIKSFYTDDAIKKKQPTLNLFHIA